jgi:hypothetical protein
MDVGRDDERNKTDEREEIEEIGGKLPVWLITRWNWTALTTSIR